MSCLGDNSWSKYWVISNTSKIDDAFLPPWEYMHSISVPVRNKQLRDEMYEFLQRLYQPWYDVVEDEDLEPAYLGPYIDEDLGGPELRIGWECKSGVGPEREYHYAILRWIALQVGRRKKVVSGKDLNQLVSYVLQDDDTEIPVLLASEWKGKKAPGSMVDYLGLMTDTSVSQELAWLYVPNHVFASVSLMQRDPDKVRAKLIAEGMEGATACLDVIKSQIARLHSLWGSRNKSPK